MVGAGLESLVREVKASAPSLAHGMLLSAFRKVFTVAPVIIVKHAERLGLR